MERPQTKYATLGDAQIAYQVFGQEPPAPALVQVTGSISHVEERWGHRVNVDSFARLASFSRVITFDQRGLGMSDPLPPDAHAPWENWMEDLRCVLDTVGYERAAILAGGEAGGSAMLFAATYPERTSALFLVNTCARYLVTDDYPCGVTEDVAMAAVKMFQQSWGTPAGIAAFAPDQAGEPGFFEWSAHVQRCSATPRAVAAQLTAAMTGDVRQALPLIQAPTVVFHRSPAYRWVPQAMGHYLAERIPGARFVELAGADSWIYAKSSPDAYDVIEEVMTGGLHARESDRVFATVVVEDVVGSTARAVELGDATWTRLLDRHDQFVAAAVRDQQGRIVNTTGDGAIAVFDSPSRAIRCANRIREAIRELDIEVRVGIHAGEIERRGDDVAGIGVHIAARVSALAEASEVLVSGTVKDLVVGSGITFTDRGAHELKGVPGSWPVFAVQQ